MGIMINLDVSVSKITSQEWQSVYEETLKLIEAYPFMDIIFDEKSYKKNFAYLQKTTNRTIEQEDNCEGWYAIGDMDSFEYAEPFILINSIDYYKKRNNREIVDGVKCFYDTYFALLKYNDPGIDEVNKMTVNSYTVFSAKTQGFDYHLPILAIACLIEDRIKPYAVVYGDISQAQIEEAILWANKYLEKPINLPDRADNELLFSRLNKEIKNDLAKLEAFLKLNLREMNCETGDFVVKNFQKETIRVYWEEQIKRYKCGTIGFSGVVKKYLNLHFDLNLLCEICVISDNGSHLEIKDFVEMLLDLGITEQKENSQNLLEINDPKNPAPETVDSLFGKMFLSIRGCHDSADMFIAEDELKKLLYDKIGNNDEIDSCFINFNNKQTSVDYLPNELKFKQEVSSQKPEDIKVYDISNRDDLFKWSVGKTLHPSLFRNLKMFYDFCDKAISEDRDIHKEILDFDNKAKMECLLDRYKYFYISKTSWDFIIDNLENKKVFFRILCLFSLDASAMAVSNYLKAIFNNLNLLKAFTSEPFGIDLNSVNDSEIEQIKH